MPNYTKTCSFLHDHYTETYKVVEKFVKNLFYAEKHAFIEKIYVVGTHLEFLIEAFPLCTTYVTEIKETYFEIYTKQVLCPLAFLSQHLKLSISFKIVNCLYLHDSYITKFDFVNYAFANLLVAWL